MPQQPHTEQTIRHTNDEQDTGNHKLPGSPDADGADRFGGTRAGANNLEHAPAREALPPEPAAKRDTPEQNS